MLLLIQVNPQIFIHINSSNFKVKTTKCFNNPQLIEENKCHLIKQSNGWPITIRNQINDKQVYSTIHLFYVQAIYQYGWVLKRASEAIYQQNMNKFLDQY